MPREEINWKRVTAALYQDARRKGSQDRVEPTLEILRQLIDRCGEFSCTTKMARRIGQVLLAETGSTVIAPSCPDYTHENGKYTFQGLGGGVSLLAGRHITFLREMTRLLPKIKPIILFPDHEADDPEFCARVQKTKTEFLDLLRSSVIQTANMVSPWGWQVMLMTELIPDLVQREQAHARQISETADYRARLASELRAREDLYYRINPRFTRLEKETRTVASAAQYVAMGTYAAEHGYLVCNHTGANLSWYLQTNTAVLHNPITV